MPLSRKSGSTPERGPCSATLHAHAPIAIGRSALHGSHTLTFLDDRRAWLCTACGRVSRLRALKPWADATWPLSRTAANWINDTGKGPIEVPPTRAFFPQDWWPCLVTPCSGRSPLPLPPAVLRTLPRQARTTCGCRCSRLVTTTKLEPSCCHYDSPPALCFMPLRACAGTHCARVGDEGLHDSPGRYLSGLI